MEKLLLFFRLDTSLVFLNKYIKYAIGMALHTANVYIFK